MKLKTLLQEIMVKPKSAFMLRNLNIYTAYVNQPLYIPFKYNISGEEDWYSLKPGEAIMVFESKTDGWYILSNIAAASSPELEDRVYIVSATYLSDITYDPGTSRNPSDPEYSTYLKLLNTLILQSRHIFLRPATR